MVGAEVVCAWLLLVGVSVVLVEGTMVVKILPEETPVAVAFLVSDNIFIVVTFCDSVVVESLLVFTNDVVASVVYRFSVVAFINPKVVLFNDTFIGIYVVSGFVV